MSIRPRVGTLVRNTMVTMFTKIEFIPSHIYSAYFLEGSRHKAYFYKGKIIIPFCVSAIGFNVETVTYKNLKFQVWDLGGQTSIR